MLTQIDSTIQEELNKIENSLVNGVLTREQYLELYAVQQALTWVLNSELAAAPYNVVMDGKIQPLIQDLVPTEDTLAN